MNRYLCVYLDEYINTHVNLIEADTEEEALINYSNFLNSLGIQFFKNEIYPFIMYDFDQSEKGMNIKMQKVNKKILLSIIIIWIILGVTVSFAMYKTNLNIQYKSNTGEMICDIIIDKNEAYIKNGIPYFYVKVRNWRENNGEDEITATDCEYSISIKNKEKQNGVFIWKKIDSEDFISTYSNTFTTKMYSIDKSKTEDVFQVFVKNQDKLNKNVDIIIELNSIQNNMN